MFDANSTQTFSTDVTLYARWNVYTTKSGSFSASVQNWVGGSRAISFGTVFESNPTVSISNSTSEPNWRCTASSINRGACILSWGASGASGATATVKWTAKSGTRPSVTVSDITTTSCKLTYSVSASGGNGTIYWTATGEI